MLKDFRAEMIPYRLSGPVSPEYTPNTLAVREQPCSVFSKERTAFRIHISIVMSAL